MKFCSQINDHMVSSYMRRYTVDDWMLIDLDPHVLQMAPVDYDAPCSSIHSKHNFASDENNGHDMGYRISLTIEELASYQP